MTTTASSMDTLGHLGLTDRRNASTQGEAPVSRRLLSLVPSQARTSTNHAPVTAVRSIDEAVIAIIDAPLGVGETFREGFGRKERELAAVFAALTIPEARAIHARLTNPRPDDALAAKFGRLAIERRTHLIEFLAGARRREAIAAARR